MTQMKSGNLLLVPERREEKRIVLKRGGRGEARKSYHFSKELQSSFEETDDLPGPSDFQPSDWNAKVCKSCAPKSCAPILSKYYDTFKGMKRQGSELKRRKTINPHPKRPESQQYRDLVKQNEWLRNNVFDTLGNFYFCSGCIRHALGISHQRLSRQRSIKKRLSNEPVRSITKSEVEASVNVLLCHKDVTFPL